MWTDGKALTAHVMIQLQVLRIQLKYCGKRCVEWEDMHPKLVCSVVEDLATVNWKYGFRSQFGSALQFIKRLKQLAIKGIILYSVTVLWVTWRTPQIICYNFTVISSMDRMIEN